MSRSASPAEIRRAYRRLVAAPAGVADHGGCLIARDLRAVHPEHHPQPLGSRLAHRTAVAPGVGFLWQADVVVVRLLRLAQSQSVVVESGAVLVGALLALRFQVVEFLRRPLHDLGREVFSIEHVLSVQHPLGPELRLTLLGQVSDLVDLFRLAVCLRRHLLAGIAPPIRVPCLRDDDLRDLRVRVVPALTQRDPKGAEMVQRVSRFVRRVVDQLGELVGRHLFRVELLFAHVDLPVLEPERGTAGALVGQLNVDPWRAFTGQVGVQ